MAPNPRVVGAFRAMKAIGITEEKVKPVLKNLIRLYNKNWDLIEEENYRVLADAIFDNEEAKDQECKPSSQNAEQEALEQDEPEPPLKRQRLKNQLSRPNGSSDCLVQNQSLDSHQVMGNESQPGSCSSLSRNKGKEHVSSDSFVPHEGSPSSQPSGMNKSLPVSKRAGSTSGSAVPLSPMKKSLTNHSLIKPKDEPITDDFPHLAVPLAVIHAGPSGKGESLVASGLMGRRDDFDALQTVDGSDSNVRIQPSLVVVNGKPETSMGKSPSGLEIASSLSGEVKIILNCGSALERSDFHMPTLDAVLKLMEDRCLKKFKEHDPNFSVMKVMADVCQCFWEMGSGSTRKSSAK